MRRALPFALLVLAAPVMAAAPPPATIMDVAPTTLDLGAGAPGLFFVTNHGMRPIAVQIEAVDWHQDKGRDTFTSSRELVVSPPFAQLAPGARQSVRVMANPAQPGERAYRLLVSELPDIETAAAGVHVLLQFSVPVFVRHDPRIAPQLRWTARDGRLIATNSGSQTVKLEHLAPGGAGLTYLLPGATRDLGALPDALHMRARDGRSGTDLAIDLAP